ncbi:MAG: hypothetical protein JWP89_5840 [Schlesneria sp.]|nr:hypothetical protein [Schlesneria sp.]
MLISFAKSRYQNFGSKVLKDASLRSSERCVRQKQCQGQLTRCLSPIFQAVAQEVVEVGDVINLLGRLGEIVFDPLKFDGVPI